MGKKVTNINNGGHVDIQDDKTKDKDKNTKTTNVNRGGSVGIQAGTVDNESVVIRNGKRVR